MVYPKKGRKKRTFKYSLRSARISGELFSSDADYSCSNDGKLLSITSEERIKSSRELEQLYTESHLMCLSYLDSWL